MALPNSDLPTSILFCRLCQSLYRDPRTLPCLHSFCLECLQHLAPTAGPQGQPALPCPLCGQEAPLPPGGIRGLTSNAFLARMCREYVGEVQKTLVHNRSLSPVAGVARQASPTMVLAGHSPPAAHFQYPPSSPQYRSSPQANAASPGGVHSYRDRALSPPRSPLSDPSVRSRHSSWAVSHGFPRGASPSSSPGYTSPSGFPTSPRHCMSSSTASDAVLQTTRRLSSESFPTRGVGVQRRLSSTPQDVVRTWECLQRKLNSLQTASLQVTYSLETVNMAEGNWHQRKQDLRRDVQRRSAQLQFFIKRQERLLLAALDARKTDDSFNLAAEQARSDLRVNLKALMHETDVLRSVLDLATDAEIMALSTLLLTSKVSQNPVTMESPELRFLVPEDLTLEGMVGRDFGCLTSTMISHSIFTPEDIVLELPEDREDDDAFTADTSTTNASLAASPTSSSGHFGEDFEDVAYIDDDDEEDEVVVEEVLEFVNGKMQLISKRSVPSSKKHSITQERPQQAADPGSKDQSKRGRAPDVRRTANSSTPVHAPREDTSQQSRRSRSEKGGEQAMTNDQTDGGESDPPNTIEKFQSLRESLKQKRRELLLNTPLFPPEGPPGMAHLLRGEKRVQSLDRTASVREDKRRSFSKPAPTHPEEPTVAAPVITTPTHTTERKDITEHGHVVSVDSAPGMMVTAPSMTTSLTSPESTVSVTDRSSRPVRRAISAASDRASKMEYLRETWRKRKELLMQNEGYISAPADQSEESRSSSEVSVKDAGDQDNEGEGVISPSGHKSKIKHSIKSRISHLKHALKKNAKGEEGPQQSKAGGKGTGGGVQNTATSITTTRPMSPAYAAAQAAAEKKVLRTIESILQKKTPAAEADTSAQPALSAQPGLHDPSLASKPSMLVKPCPREPPSAVPAAPTATTTTTTTTTTIPMPLETLQEDEDKTVQTARKPALRVTSPVRGEANKEALQHMRANIRQKKERWRSLSLN